MARVLVICGGDNRERRVSLSGGDAVAGGLAAAGHDAWKLDTASPDRLVPPDTPLLDGPVGVSPPEETELATLDRAGWLALVRTLVEHPFDIVIPLLHGTWGEGGQIQALLELLEQPFLGSGMRASAIALDKRRTHQAAGLLGLPVPEAKLLPIPPGDDAAFARALEIAVSATRDEAWARYARKTPHPVVFKPNLGGSTVGIYIGADPDGLRGALTEIIALDDVPLLEEYVPGRELTVTMLGGEPLPMIEIVPHEGYYDYTSKYTKGKTDYLCPAPVAGEVHREAAELSVMICEELGVRDVARVDFRLSERDELVFLEVNTIPGMTALSLVPMAAKQAGLDFPALMNRLVELVRAR